MIVHNRYGWHSDLPDRRDLMLVSKPTVLPDVVDLRPKCPSVYDQGDLGSCTGNAIAAALQFDQLKQGQQSFVPSRLFIYYNERVIEHTIGSDSGAMIRDGMKSVNKRGACQETTWPYDPSRFTNKPSKAAFAEALRHRVLSYRRVQQAVDQLRAVLASGFPIVFGFTAFESFENQGVAQTGIVPMPSSNESVLGGHAVLAVGYDHSSQRFIVRNSWGEFWGQAGYFTMPYEYLIDTQLAKDFWMVNSVE